MKTFSLLILVCFCHLVMANNNGSFLMPSLFEGAPLFSNINVAQQSTESFRFQLLYENRFLLKDLSPKFISFEKSFDKHQWTFCFSDWGSRYYKERGGSLNYSMKLSPKLYVGVGTLVQIVSQFNHGELKMKIFPVTGFQYHVLEKSKLFSSFKAGVSGTVFYKAYLGFLHEFSSSYELFVLMKSTKEEKVFLSLGLKHKRGAGDEFVLQLNNNNYPVALAYRLVWKQFSFRLSMYYHIQLGVSNHVGVGYQTVE